MQTSEVSFYKNTQVALADSTLQQSLGQIKQKFVGHRQAAVDHFGQERFESLREYGKAVRDFGIAHMPALLEQFSDNAERAGATVLWAADAQKANAIISKIARRHGVQRVIKSKSMVSEEIFLNDHLQQNNIQVTETDLGEFIIQMADEKPSHIIAPAMHKSRGQITALLAGIGCLPDDNHQTITQKARGHLRQKFLSADMGITGANFLLADTGSCVIVTNEGNGRLTTTLPPVHVTLASIDKILPSIANLPPMLGLLTRSATGQTLSNYVSITTGNKNDNTHRYIVLLDNGRSDLRQSAYKEMLRCIRCGACMNHCPVYHTVGGQAYGSVYMGPMGQVITGGLLGVKQTPHLPHAATLCHACSVVCPVKIPLPQLIRRLRDEQVALRLDSFWHRLFINLWSAVARRPRLYRCLTNLGLKIISLFSNNGIVKKLPFMDGWFKYRYLKLNGDKTFSQQWREIQRSDER